MVHERNRSPVVRFLSPLNPLRPVAALERDSILDTLLSVPVVVLRYASFSECANADDLGSLGVGCGVVVNIGCNSDSICCA